MDDATDTVPPALVFEAPYVSPFDDMDVVRSPYEVVSGTCPLCNNPEHKRIDERIIRGWKVKSIVKEYRVSDYDVAFHILHHLLPIYGELCARVVPEAVRDEYDLIAQEQKYLENNATPEAKPSREFDPWVNHGDADYTKYDYEHVDRTRPWTRGRTVAEIVRRETEAIDFFASMVKLKKDAERIHDEIMDSEREDRISSESPGGTSYAQKNYGAAIKSVEVQKGILMDLAKLALLKTRADEVSGKEGPSAAVSEMLGSILGDNIFETTRTLASEMQAVRLQEDDLVKAELVDDSRGTAVYSKEDAIDVSTESD